MQKYKLSNQLHAQRKEAVINNAIYFLLLIVVIYTTVKNPNFIKAPSIVNIISLSAANLPIACGIAGCIVLTGTDLNQLQTYFYRMWFYSR